MATTYTLNYTGSQLDSAIQQTNTNTQNLSSHISDSSNPHNTTAAQVGLGNVDNTSDINKPISTATQIAINSVQELALQAKSIAEGRSKAKVFATEEAMTLWLADADNVSTLNIGDNLYIEDINVPDYWWTGTEPQILETSTIDLTDYYTKIQVDNLLQQKYTKPSDGIPLSDLSTQVQTSLSKANTAIQSLPEASTDVAGIALLGTTGGAARYGYAADVGLGNVDNTSDADKPISKATQSALNQLSLEIEAINNIINQEGYSIFSVRNQ